MQLCVHVLLSTAHRLGLCVCVGGQQLAVSDADTAPDELEFELVEAPIHGELIKTDGSTHISMTNGEMTHARVSQTYGNLMSQLLTIHKNYKQVRH